MALLLLILGLVLCLYPYLRIFSMLLCLAFAHGFDTGILIPGRLFVTFYNNNFSKRAVNFSCEFALP